MKTATILLAAFLFSASASASAVEWKTHPVADGITVEFPGEPHSANAGTQAILYEGVDESGAPYKLMYMSPDAPSLAIRTTADLKELYAGLHEGAAESAARNGAEISELAIVDAGGLQAAESTLRTPVNIAMGRYIYVNGRVHQLFAMSPTENGPLATRFFDSFHVAGNAVQLESAEAAGASAAADARASGRAAQIADDPRGLGRTVGRLLAMALLGGLLIGVPVWLIRRRKRSKN